jgi:glycosyltransferase involved in cell wall biosynthesis
MACGMACVVVDYGGPATLISDQWGVKVPLGDLDYLVQKFTQELEQLVKEPDRVERLGLAAHHHAMSNYSWDAKAKMTMEVYNWVTGSQKVKPNFVEKPITIVPDPA